jgi:hypothetical protein
MSEPPVNAPPTDGDPGPSFLGRLIASFNEQAGAAKILIGVGTAVSTAIALAGLAWLSGVVSGGGSDGPTDSGVPFTFVTSQVTPQTWNAWLDTPMPPSGEWPGPYPDEWAAFVRQRGATFDSTWVRIVLDGVAERAVTITEARAHKIDCVTPTPLGHYVQTADGADSTIGWYFDLGERDPIAYELLEEDEQGGPYFQANTISLAPGEVLTIDAKAFAGPDDCRWTIELDVVVGGEMTVVTIDDGGVPFRTSGGDLDIATHVVLPGSDGVFGADGIDGQMFVYPTGDWFGEPEQLYDWSGSEWMPGPIPQE